MAQQLVLRFKAVLGRELGRAVLKLGGPKPPVGGVVLPVNPLTAFPKGIGKGLYKCGINSSIGVKSLFDMDD